MMTLGAPVLVLVAFLGGAAAFAATHRLPAVPSRAPSAIAGRFFSEYVLWLMTPFERRVSLAPNLITLISFLVAVAAATAIAFRWYAVGAWLVTISGLLDILDGHVARRTGRASKAGAFLDSVTDRWGELAIACAIVIAFRHFTFGIAAALASLGGAQMVSYTRARGESLGIALQGGTMQRPERVVAVTGALLLGGVGRETHWFDGELAMAIVLGVVGAWTSITAVQRLRDGMRALAMSESISAAVSRNQGTTAACAAVPSLSPLS